jgi:ketosteroid isomerase-like protein
MGKFCYALLAMGLVLSLGSQPAEESEVDLAAEQQAIRELHDKLIKGYELKDFEIWANNIAHDPETVNMGPAVEHYFVGWEELKKGLEIEWAAVSDAKVTVSDMKINVLPGGKYAWSTCRFDFQATVGGQPLFMPCRQTAIYEKRDSGWILIHFHDSTPVGVAE